MLLLWVGRDPESDGSANEIVHLQLIGIEATTVNRW